jgi:hypothetical protein
MFRKKESTGANGKRHPAVNEKANRKKVRKPGNAIGKLGLPGAKF